MSPTNVPRFLKQTHFAIIFQLALTDRKYTLGQEEASWLISKFPSAVRSIFRGSLVGRSVYPRHLCLAYQASAMFEHVTV